jgi:hypothetical protein
MTSLECPLSSGPIAVIREMKNSLNFDVVRRHIDILPPTSSGEINRH